MAAVISGRLYKHLQDNIDISQYFLWSDSQIVLNWLKTSKTLPRFVRNRVSEIQSLTNNKNWRYCPTSENPADLLTRGISAKQFKLGELWFHGPEWLSNPEDWPVWPEMDRTFAMTTTTDLNDDGVDDEIEVSLTTVCDQSHTIDFTKYSRLTKLHRVIAYVCRFLHNCRVGRSQSRLGPLTCVELQKAERVCIVTCQREKFSDVKTNIKSKKIKHSIIKQLQLFVDKDDIIR